MATDSYEWDADRNLQKIKNRGFDVFVGAINRTMFGEKNYITYWQKLTEAMQYSAYDIIFIEDDTTNLRNAKSNGVKTVDSKDPMPNILKNLDAHYQIQKAKLSP